MTDPPNARRRGRAGRFYVWPPEPPHEMTVPSVTNICDKLPKYLVPWASKAVAEYAVDHRRSWENLPRNDAVDLLKRVTQRTKEAAGERGTAVHKAIQAHIEGTRYVLGEHEKGYFDAALAFLVDREVVPFRSEVTVYSRRYGYAGTADLLATFRNGDPHGLWVVDFKTSKSVYDDNGVQLAAYSRADFFDGGGYEDVMPQIDGGLIVRLDAQGGYEVVPFDLTPGLFDVFLAAKTVFDWSNGLAKEVKGKAWAA